MRGVEDNPDPADLLAMTVVKAYRDLALPRIHCEQRRARPWHSEDWMCLNNVGIVTAHRDVVGVKETQSGCEQARGTAKLKAWLIRLPPAAMGW